MSTYYGIKPIVGDGLKVFVHGLNIQGYDSGDNWTDSRGNSVTFVVSSSLVESRGRRRYFDTSGSLDITSIDSPLLNPRTGSYSLTVWFKANSNEGYIFEKGNQFNLFLTGTNHLLWYIQPTTLGTPFGIAVSGSYGIATGIVSNNHTAMLKFNADTMEVDYCKWSYTIGQTYQGTYDRRIAIGTASFMQTSLSEIWEHNYLNREYETQAYTRRPVDYTYAAGDPSTNAQYTNDVDFNDKWLYVANDVSYLSRNGWVEQRLRWGGNGAGPSATASAVNGVQSLCIDKLPLSTGSFVYATATSDNKIVKLSQDSLSLDLETGSLGTGDHQFSTPQGIQCDQEYVYVGDSGNNRIMVFDKQLRYVTQSNVGHSIYDLSVTNKYLFYNGGDYKVHKLDKYTLCESGSFQVLPVKGNGWYAYAPKTAYATGGYYFVGNRSNNFNVFKKKEHGNFFMVGRTTSIPGHSDSWACTLNHGVINSEPTGQVWFADNDGDTVDVHNYNSNYTLTLVTSSFFGTNGWQTHQWNAPRGIALDKENNWVFVTDYSNHRIKKLRANDLVLLALTGSNVSGGISQSAQPVAGDGDHEFRSPWGITQSGSYIYVANEAANNVKQFTKDLQFVQVLSVTGGDPTRVEYDKSSDTFIVFTADRTIRRYDNQWNEIGAKDYGGGQENPDMITAFYYGINSDGEFIYNPDLWKNAIIFDKDKLCWENEIDAYKVTMRSKAIDTGSWHSATFTWDGDDTMKIYVDGEYQTSASMANFNWSSYTPDIQNSKPMRFGKWKWYTYSNQFVETKVGAVMVYHKVLTDGEIRQNYDALKWEFK